MKTLRIAVALLFTAAGITPLVAVPLAWGGQGFTATTQVHIDGRTAETFPAKATTTVPAAVPQTIQPPAAATPEARPPVTEAPATSASRPSRSAKPSASPSASQSTGN